ncbi:hypothetical protein JTE90_012447 [Oedothorax gibbosus]|uniref:Uncharacterized protein n=1 Tax=Oedothorax gibbosus TaxID=931172 RepID=A0AAV6TZU5_9ARAC|nr:hypothetical protein JTE90_012447 [Oedothorax gibbosus]
MALINSCCFCSSVRSGSFAAGFYTLILYTIILTAGVFHLDIIKETVGMLVISLLTLVLSGFCVVACILLLIGLCVDSRMLLIPWMVLVLITTVLDLLVSLYLLIDAMFSSFLAILFGIDFFILGLNVYCLICVYSQYQDYCDGREARGHRLLPPVEYLGHRDGDANLGRISADNGLSSSVTQTSVPTGYSDVTDVIEELKRVSKEGYT